MSLAYFLMIGKLRQFSNHISLALFKYLFKIKYKYTDRMIIKQSIGPLWGEKYLWTIQAPRKKKEKVHGKSQDDVICGDLILPLSLTVGICIVLVSTAHTFEKIGKSCCQWSRYDYPFSTLIKAGAFLNIISCQLSNSL